MTTLSVEQKVQSIRNQADRYVSQRLSRGNIRIQNSAFHTETEWEELRKTQSERMARLNQKLK